MAYPLEQLKNEVGFIAYHFHWSMDEILSLSHSERIGWVGQVSKINQRILDAADQ